MVKIIIYLIASILAYTIIRDAFNGTINTNTTIGNAALEIKKDSIQTIEDIKNDVSSTFNTLKEQNKTK